MVDEDDPRVIPGDRRHCHGCKEEIFWAVEHVCPVLTKLQADLAAANHQNQEQQKKYSDLLQSHYSLCCKIEEQREALEIALPSMAHTFSGHDDPSVWVDGCGKCRVARLLTNPSKRNDEPALKCEGCQQVKPDVLPYCSDCYHAT